jgi:predicted dehydrogenase
LSENDSNLERYFDAIFICTPPNVHIEEALNQMGILSPKLLLIEKPLSSPKELNNLFILENLCELKNSRFFVGYNHRLTENTVYMSKLILENNFGKMKFIRANFRENWQGILDAHPWLHKPSDSYLGHTYQGGGSLFEHSHGLDLLLYVANLAGLTTTKIKSVAFSKFSNDVSSYDENVIAVFDFGDNVLGLLEQNVFTSPPEKKLVIEYEKAKIVWFTSDKVAGVKVIDQQGKLIDSFIYSKNRRDDFLPQLKHIQMMLKNGLADSPISIKNTKTTQLLLDEMYKRF